MFACMHKYVSIILYSYMSIEYAQSVQTVGIFEGIHTCMYVQTRLRMCSNYSQYVHTYCMYPRQPLFKKSHFLHNNPTMLYISMINFT